jgi:hypothetical protein
MNRALDRDQLALVDRVDDPGRNRDAVLRRGRLSGDSTGHSCENKGNQGELKSRGAEQFAE